MSEPMFAVEAPGSSFSSASVSDVKENQVEKRPSHISKFEKHFINKGEKQAGCSEDRGIAETHF